MNEAYGEVAIWDAPSGAQNDIHELLLQQDFEPLDPPGTRPRRYDCHTVRGSIEEVVGERLAQLGASFVLWQHTQLDEVVATAYYDPTLGWAEFQEELTPGVPLMSPAVVDAAIEATTGRDDLVAELERRTAASWRRKLR